jgi:uncharacterized protein YfaS (alpha-2-macroglobulin family)
MLRILINSIIGLSIVAASACSSSNELALVSRNFDNQIEERQNLVFEFSRPSGTPVVADSVLNLWDTTEYVRITPRVAGSFKWTSPTTLVFSPSVGFKPSTDYKAELSEALLTKLRQDSGRAAERLSLPKVRSFDFHTPYLSLSSAEATWTKRLATVSAGGGSSSNTSGIEVRVELGFNYAVQPANLAERLRMTIDGKQYSADIKTTAPDKAIIIGVHVPSAEGGKTMTVEIDKGLQCAESEYQTPEKISLSVAIPPTDEFKISAVTTDYDDDTPVIRVITSQSIDESDPSALKALVRVSPRPQNFDILLTDNGMILRGAFQPDTSYQLTIARSLKGIFGITLAADYVQTVMFGSLQPTIAFVESKAMYLTSAGNRMIAARIVGVNKIRFVVEKVYENNILAFTRGSTYDSEGIETLGEKRYFGEYDEAAQEYHSYRDYQEVDDVGDPVYEKTLDVKTLPKQHGYYLLNMNVQDKLPGKGLYIVRVFSTDQKWLRDSRIIAVSDIGLIAKYSADEMVVIANSIKTAEPLSGVEVRLVTRNNQSPFKTQTTDKNGIARFTGIKQTTPGSAIAMVVATQGSEVNYLLLDKSRVETSRYDVGGLVENSAGYQAFLYGDRDIYRPGETVRINTVVRTQAWEPVAGVPVKVKILTPTGKEYATFRHTLNPEGAAETILTMPASALTGLYAAEVYTMNDVLLNTRRFQIEEFMPDRISVTPKLSAQAVMIGGAIQLQATALNLFGPPAANRDYTVTLSLKRKQFLPAGFERYDFTIKGGDYVPLEEQVRQGRTNEQGMLYESFGIAETYRDLGLLQGRMLTTVFDETGRPVNRLQTFDVATQTAMFGIRQFDVYQSTRQPLTIGLVAVGNSGKALDNVQAQVRVIRYNWQTALERDPYSGQYRYVSQRQEVTELERIMTLSGQSASLVFTPRQSGEYEVRVTKPGAKTYVSRQFYAYGYGDTQSSSFEVSKEGEITIEADKSAYATGETAKLLFKTPFAGKLLISIERNRVIEEFWVNTDQKSASFALDLKDEHVPNVYISATLIKPLDDGSGGTMPLTVAYGFRSITVEKASTRLPVSITLDEQTRSNTKKTITVSTGESNAELTIAVVDEGILQLKGTRTPDPYGFFYQKRALQVSSHNVYPLLFPALKLRSSSAAGDAALLENRVNPLTNKRVKLIALWSGHLKASGGKVSYTFDVPEFSGALRVMAVAYKGKSFGSAEKTMRVADPIVISSALPRFLSPNDEVQMPVILTNTTNKPAQAAATVEVKGAARVVGAARQSVNIPPNSEAQVLFTLAAAQGVGTADVQVNVNGLGETFRQKTELTVRPLVSLTKASGSGSLKAGEQASFRLGGDYVGGTARGRLVVSASPIVQFAGNLSALVGYPYGCIEQTISAAFPQLYVADLAKSLGQGNAIALRSAQGNVQEAIRKIASMQLYNGSLSYWPGNAEESWWGSAYAAHFLLEAQKAGYDVSEEFQKRLYGYLAKKVKERNYEYYGYYNRAGEWRTKTIPAKTILYSLYVLSLANRPDVPTMNYYKANKDSLALDSRYLLAVAYFLAGDKGSYRALLPKEFSGEKSGRAFGGSFYSYIRDEALALNALLEAEPENPQIGMMTKHLSTALKTERYLNTQEHAFALLALGKVARRTASTTLQASITVAGKQITQFQGSDVVIQNREMAGAQASVRASASGSGFLYYFWETEGVPTVGAVPEEDSYLRVRRTLLDRNGRPLAADAIRHNDLVVVKLSLSSTNGARVENVVLTDMLPAGLEIENPRIGSVPELSWIRDNAEPQYSDIRDDRIHFFVTADGTTRSYYYLCRAVSKGTFFVGPASADAMYNGEYHSYSGAGVVKISDRQTAMPALEQ